MPLEIEHVILIIFGVATIAFSLCVLVVAVLSYRIAILYAPRSETQRRIPTLGQRLRRAASAADDTPEPVKGVNDWPDSDEEVATDEPVTHFAGAAEATQATDREEWWVEQREKGYSDEEIKEMEDSRVVPVFESAR